MDNVGIYNPTKNFDSNVLTGDRNTNRSIFLPKKMRGIMLKRAIPSIKDYIDN